MSTKYRKKRSKNKNIKKIALENTHLQINIFLRLGCMNGIMHKRRTDIRINNNRNRFADTMPLNITLYISFSVPKEQKTGKNSITHQITFFAFFYRFLILIYLQQNNFLSVYCASCNRASILLL